MVIYSVNTNMIIAVMAPYFHTAAIFLLKRFFGTDTIQVNILQEPNEEWLTATS